MPTYTIQGKKITTEAPLSDVEIDEIAKDLGAEASSAVSQIPTGGYPAAPEAVAQRTAGERAFQNALSGAAAVPILGAGARIVQSLMQGTKYAPYATNLAQALLPQSGKALAAEGVIGAAGGVVGGEVGQQVAQKFGETYRGLGEFVGGMGGGLAANTAVRNVPELVSAGVRAVGGTPAAGQVSDLIGGVRAQSKLQTALAANPSLAGDLARAKEIEALTGVKLPIGAASKGDTTLTGLLQGETARGENAAFTALINRQEKDALDAVEAAKRQLAADPTNRIENIARLRAAQDNAAVVKKEAEFERQQIARQERLDKLDEYITDVSMSSMSVSSGKQDIGARVANVLEAKKKILQAEFTPQYTELLKQAKDEGVALDSPQVAALWNFIKTNKAEDVFAKFPALFKPVQQALAPSKAPVSSKFAEKYPNLVRSAEGTYKPMDVDTIDSLKRAINKSLSSTSDKDQIRMLSAFKKEFETALDSVPGDFSQKYKALDRAYADKVGLPFSENGVLMVNRAKFVENTVPYLTSSPSAVKQIMAATDNSPETAKIVEDAFLLKLSNSPSILNKETGQINVPSLNLFLKQNKEALDAVPGLADKLKQTGSYVQSLKEARGRIFEEQQKASLEQVDSLWTKTQGTSGGFRGFVASALKKPEQMDQLLTLIASTEANRQGVKTTVPDQALKRGLKTTILDLALNSPSPTTFFTENAKTIDTVFGGGHSAKIQALLEASERLAQNPLSTKINQSITQRTGFEARTGSRPEQLLSEARNPVLGNFRAAANALSRYFQNRSTKSEAAEIQEFLSNPKAVGDAAELLKEITGKTRGVTQQGKELLAKLSKNSASAGIFGGLASVVPGELGLSARQPVQQFEALPE